MPAGPPLTTHSPPKPRRDSTAILNAFTVDVEDYFQVSAFEKHIPRDQWDRWESRVSANTHRVLELLDRHCVRATFFVLGWNAERHPELVREIHACGHEIGSHGYWHRLIYQQTPAEFRADL
ncbi:MAG: polysaccharide deacetylase family protein, partial [Planctomycetes bacterium]|nr:polysaccharide deacetylase family protein [Planctomycetota bacterium]